jgi:hypothetical protein
MRYLYCGLICGACLLAVPGAAAAQGSIAGM